METNDDKALKIAEGIEKHRKGELKMNARNNAIGMANVFCFNQVRQFWLVNNENNRGRSETRDFAGNVISISGPATTYINDGQPIFKNTRIGEILIRNSKGTHKIPTPKDGFQDLTIYNNAFYAPENQPNFARDIKINLNESKPRYYSKLSEILQLIGELDQQISENERLKEEQEELIQQQKTKDTKRRDELIEKIDKGKKEREETLNKMQSFIRKSTELRYQPILDPWQEEIKRSLLFEGTMAINGGPGTGKTTSLIQRMKFLTDSTAFEDYFPNLTDNQKNKLTEGKSWIFFSPSELLKQFLKNNMTREGLLANDETVKVWEDHKRTLLRRYNLVNTETQNPFLVLRTKSEEPFLPYDSKSLKKVIQSFENYFMGHQNEKLVKLASIDVSPFKWKNKGKSIQLYISRQDKAYNLEGIIRLYFNVEENFALEVKNISKQFFELLTRTTVGIIVEIEKNPKISERLKILFENWKEESRHEEIEEFDDLEDVIEEESEVEQENDFDDILLRRLKTLVRKSSLILFDKNQRLSKREKELNEIIINVIDIKSISEFNELGQLAYFVKYFERVTKGIKGNLISEIPALYKAFRKRALKEKTLPINMNLLLHIVEKESDTNKRIHPDEQALLLYFINDFVKRSYKVSKSKSDMINHSYFEAYRDMCKPVIGIDEATDFHLIDLLCIHSLGDLDLSSVTFSGDLMQRLTNVGLRDWSEIKTFIPKFEVKELFISYRQSPTLIQIAQQLYQNATLRKAEYISYMDQDLTEPKPLFYINKNEEECIQWMAKRILEIHAAYGGKSIPSIAVFLPQEKEIQSFAARLGDIDQLADVNIKVMACTNGQVLGEDNTVRVFSLNYIKGLEFEAVFFHHIDEVMDTSNNDLMSKNLYVGLSRAAFYLGITSRINIDEIAQLPGIIGNNNANWKAV